MQGRVLKSFDATKAKGMPGVIDVVQIADGVAVVADTYWRARQARQALTVEWNEGANAGLTAKAMFDGTRAALDSGKPIPVKRRAMPTPRSPPLRRWWAAST